MALITAAMPRPQSTRTALPGTRGATLHGHAQQRQKKSEHINGRTQPNTVGRRETALLPCLPLDSLALPAHWAKELLLAKAGRAKLPCPRLRMDNRTVGVLALYGFETASPATLDRFR